MNCDDANANQLACGGEQMCLISLRAQHQQQELTETEQQSDYRQVCRDTVRYLSFPPGLKTGDGCCPSGLRVLVNSVDYIMRAKVMVLVRVQSKTEFQHLSKGRY